MATVKKCDRCGKFGAMGTTSRVGLVINGATQTVEYDLCDSCFSTFKRFFEQKLEENH